MLLYLIADKRAGNAKAGRGKKSERTASRIRSTQECSVDIDGPKQRADGRDRHLSGGEKTDGQWRHGTHTHTHTHTQTKSFWKTLLNTLKGLQARSHFRFSHELNMALRRFVNSRPVCISSEAPIAASVSCCRSQQAQMRGVWTWIPAWVFYLSALRG